MPTLKLFLQLKPSEDSSHPYPPYNNNPTNYNKSNINVGNLNGIGNGSIYSSSPRNGNMLNGSGDGVNGHTNGTPRRSSRQFPTPPIDNPTTNPHPNKPALPELDMNFIGSNHSSMDGENAPPFRTPPRSPPSSPRNPLRTPPGSPKG